MHVIDCGANLGQGYERLLKEHNIQTTSLIMFDILPEACVFLRKKYPFAQIYNNGVWYKEENRTVKRENATLEGITKVGHESNILENNHKPTTSGFNHAWDTYQLQCINFSNFLKNKFSINDNILLKIDIEGAEYEVIDSLIENNTLSYIKSLHIEWHPHLRNDTVKPLSYYQEFFKNKNINLLN